MTPQHSFLTFPFITPSFQDSIAVAVEIAPYMATALRLRFHTHTHHAGSVNGHLTGLDHHPSALTAQG